MVFADFQSIPCSLTSAGFLVALGSNTRKKQAQNAAGPGSLVFTIQQPELQGRPVGDNNRINIYWVLTMCAPLSSLNHHPAPQLPDRLRGVSFVNIRSSNQHLNPSILTTGPLLSLLSPPLPHMGGIFWQFHSFKLLWISKTQSESHNRATIHSDDSKLSVAKLS